MKHKVKEYKFDIGDKVYYHHIIGEEHDGNVYEITQRWRLGHGENVYSIPGISGCVCEDALTLA